MTTTVPVVYSGNDLMLIGCRWRPGQSGDGLTDTDPWSGEELTRIPLAAVTDVMPMRAAQAV